MHAFADDVILPVLEAVRPEVVLEVGAAKGLMTERLLPWAQTQNATVRVIDPKPLFSVDQAREQYGDHFEMHVALSRDVLPSCSDAEVILLDGDHNWFTVTSELRAIDALATQWPIVLLHDTNWPYARRDQYYTPENIPAEFLQPHRRGGMVRGQSALESDGGRNPNGIHAEHEGGERNGVVTAIEDFLASTSRELLFCVVRGPGGLGVLVEPALLGRQPGVGDVLRANHDPALAVAISPKYGTRELPAGADQPVVSAA